MRFSPDQFFFATGSTDGTIRIFNLKNNKLIKVLFENSENNWINSIQFDSNSTFMFTCSLQCLDIYDVEKNFTLIIKFGEKDGYDQWIYVLSVSWDDRYLASGDHLGRVRLNKIGNNFQKIKSLHHHNLWVTSLVFS